MNDDANRRATERRLRITAAAYALGIVLIMGAVHTCMDQPSINEIGTRISRPHTAAPSAPVGRPCAVTSRPSGATVYALRGESDDKEALGVTPLTVSQGDYRLRVELAGFVAAVIAVGSHGGTCTLHSELEVALQR